MADEQPTVIKTGSGGIGVAIFALGIIVIGVVLFVMFGQGLLNGDTKKINADIKVEAPTKN
jgi:hypothetical protein